MCALLAGGGYATRVAVPAGQVMPLPDGVDLVTAAALPEVAATVWSNVMMVAGLRAGDTFLVHGGAGGIGTFAIQLDDGARRPGDRHGGSARRSSPCAASSAPTSPSTTASRTSSRWWREVTDGHGVDVILDNMGASYLTRNLDTLAIEGRLVVIGFQGGVEGGDRPADACSASAPR